MLFARLFVLLFAFMFSLSSHSYSQSPDSSNQNSFGWLKLSLNIEKFYLVLNEDFSNYRLMTTGDSLKLDTGKHTIRIVWNNIHDFRREIDIEEGKTINNVVSIYATPNPNSSYQFIKNEVNTIISTDPESVIFIDGNKVGEKSAQLLLNPGTHRLFIKNSEYGSISKEIQIDPRKMNTISRFNKHQSPPPFFIKLLPGGSYIANKEWVKSGITYAALIFLTSSTISLNASYNQYKEDYDRSNHLYKEAESTTLAIRHRISAISALDNMKNIDNKLTFTALGIAAVYTITTLDGFRKPKGGYKGKPHFIPELSLESNPVDGHPFAAFTFTGEF